MLIEEWRFPADRDEVGRARRAAVQFVRSHRATEEALRDVALGVSEAVTNAVLHAYCDGEPGAVHLTVELEPDAGSVTVTVVDDGRGLQPRERSPGAGFGLGIVDHVAEQIDIATPPSGRGTQVRMRFSVPFERR